MKSLIPFLIAATTVRAGTAHQHNVLHWRSTSIYSNLTKQGYTTTFLDTFAGQTNVLPSSSNWIIDTGTSYPGGAARWGNNEYETYTNSISNLYITSDNNLAITPQLSAAGTWTSGRIETQRSDFKVQEGGKLLVEGRIKLGTATAQYQQGIWPAFWALGSDFRGNYTNWPMVTEWDILEVINGGDAMYSTVHCGIAPGGPCNEYNGIGDAGDGGVEFSRGAWHTVGFMVDLSQGGTWWDETLTWYLDGEVAFSVSGIDVGDEDTWNILARGEKFLLLNVAVGGNWPGAPNANTIGGEGVGMEVGYVGVWNSI